MSYLGPCEVGTFQSEPQFLPNGDGGPMALGEASGEREGGMR